MAFGDFVAYSPKNGGTSTASSDTTTYTGTAGNLLIAVYAIRLGVTGASPTTPTGYTFLSEGFGNVGGGVYYRIATGDSNDNCAFNWGISKRWATIIYEIEGPFDGTLLDQSAENETSLSSGSNPVGVGSITASDDTVAVAICCPDAMTAAPTVDESFVNLNGSWAGSGPVPAVYIAKRTIATSAALSPEFSFLAAKVAYGAIASFNASTGGGVTPSPFGHQRLDNQYSAIAASRLNGVLQ